MNTTQIAVATAAAAAAQRALEERRREEEEMTTYSPRDLDEDWEFKILRSARGSFAVPERLREILADEARAGWKLVEIFDQYRIRLKRPASSRDADGRLEFDPYRISLQEPMPPHLKRFWIGLALFCGAIAAAMVLLTILGSLF
jgi:hypothetical protein